MTGESCTRAAVFREPGEPFELCAVDLPELGAGEVRVRVRLCTLCGSDLHTVRGHRVAPTPLVLGHEAVGEIVALPDLSPPRDARGNALSIGQRVTWSITASCGECATCRRGLLQKCERLRKYGHERLGAGAAPDGGLAEVLHLRPGTTIVPLPATLPDEVAAPASCATATVTSALRVARYGGQGAAIVYGAGMLGLTACALLSGAGASCIAVDPVGERRELALRFGVSRALDPSDSAGMKRALCELTGRGEAGLVLELSGAPQAAEAGLQLLGTGGVLVLAGSVSPSAPIAVDPERVVRRLLRIEGVHNYLPEDLVAAVDFLEVAHTRFPFADLVTPVLPLEEVDVAFEHALAPACVRAGVRPR